MSKGNLFMGYARGKVGSVVLARSKGQQITRAYNDKPKNPRTEGQMLQRSIFASAVKFFSQGRQALFQFAFENKPIKRSDYNMFVSLNTKAGIHISKAAYDEATYPVIAPWLMAKGSLTEFDLTYDTSSSVYKLALSGLASSANWGAVSASLIANYDLLAGDIITVCTVNAIGSTAANTPDVEPEKRERIEWIIKQAVIDVESTDSLSDLFGMSATTVAGAMTFIGSAGSTNAQGACVIASRNTTEGLKVNDSYLVMNNVAETIYEDCQSEGYIGQVLASWKASGKAVLQGSLVQ